MYLTDPTVKTETIRKVAEDINKKRREELATLFFQDTRWSRYLKQIRESQQYKYGSKSKVWRKIASMPTEVDMFFTKVYGADYYKDKNFFKKYAKEWQTINEKDL